MIISIVLTLSASLVLVILLAIKMRRKEARGKREDSLVRLEEVLRSAQLTNNGFFQSLELVQKNLESLLARAENAEQRLRSLMLQPGVEKKDQYTAAALLLGEGQQPERVASMLRLPLPQVEIVRELQQMSGKDKKAAARKKRDEQPVQPEIDNPSKIAAVREKFSSQPISLIDMIRKATGEAMKNDNHPAQFRGINA
jgi:ParB-like chromosome segregation protein Spo0J